MSQKTIYFQGDNVPVIPWKRAVLGGSYRGVFDLPHNLIWVDHPLWANMEVVTRAPDFVCEAMERYAEARINEHCAKLRKLLEGAK